MIQKVKSEYPDIELTSFFLDDGTLVGKVEDVAKALAIIRYDGPEYGIFINLDKTEFYCPGASNLDLITSQTELFTRFPGFKWNIVGWCDWHTRVYFFISNENKYIT